MGPKRAAVVRSRGVAAKRGFIMYYTMGVATGPRSVSAIGRVVAYQGWSLRGVPLYPHFYTCNKVSCWSKILCIVMHKTVAMRLIGLELMPL